MQKYLDLIQSAEDLDALNRIIEQAADDDGLTNAEYCQVYEAAITAAHG